MKLKLIASLLLLACSLHLPAQDMDTLVDIGSQKMHFNVWKGTGTPILFESGGGNDASIWMPLANAIHSITGSTVITYDRVGYGTSEFDSTLPDDKKALVNHGVTAMNKGLQQLGYDGEIIIVAHSYGGFYATYFASKNPALVKGLVLIDVNHVCYYTEEYVQNLKTERTEAWLLDIKTQSEPVYYECLSFYESIDLMKTIELPESIPVIDLVAQNPPFSKEADNSRWKACHRAFGDASDNRTWVLAANCGHYLHFDNEQLAVDAIVKIFTSVTSGLDYKNILQRYADYSLEKGNQYRSLEFAYWHSERETNNWGYSFLNETDLKKAIKVFELNTLLYPESANVWDSYGEALLMAGEKEKAIDMYEKSIELNPDNENGKAVLKKLRDK